MIHEIGVMIVQDAQADNQNWDALAVVSTLDGSSQLSGYAYDRAGTATPAAITNFGLFDKFKELREATREGEAGRLWKSALVQIRRADMKVMVDFEYDDPMRWEVTPGNFTTLPEELRPK